MLEKKLLEQQSISELAVWSINIFKMEEILNRLCQPDSAVIKEASEQLRQAFKDPGVIPELCRILASSQSVQSRQYAAVLLR